MNRLVFTFFLLLSINCISQSLNFSDIEYINPNESASMRPRICLVDGEPLVMFTRNTLGQKIVVNKKEEGIWLGEQVISAEGVDFQAGTRLGPAISSQDSIVYVAYILESTPRQIAFQKSNDGGVTFSESQSAFILGDDMAEGIDVIVLPDGNPVFAFLHYGPGWSNAKQVVVRSYDGGNSFSELIVIDDSPCECCTPTLIEGDGKYGVSYRDNEENVRVFKFKVSNNDVSDFSEEIVSDATNWEVSVCPASSSDGYIVGDTLYSTWMSKPNSLTEIYKSKVQLDSYELISTDLVDALPDYGAQNHPRMDGNAQTQLIVWEEFRESKKDIFGVIIQDDMYNNSFSMTEGDSIEHKENVDIVYDNESDVFHMVYRNKAENAVVYRYMEPSYLAVEDEDVEVLQIYPNPSSSILFVEGDYELAYSVFDIYGNSIMYGKCYNEIEISHLKPGTYVLELTNDSIYYRTLFLKN